jgi:hypothetical protein
VQQLEQAIAKELADIFHEQQSKLYGRIEYLETRLLLLESRQPQKGEKGDKGDPGQRGERGEPGKDGINGKDGAGPSRGRHKGPWKHNETYALDDSVTSGGSGWYAIVENPQGRPGESKDWQLFVMKGRDGKDGKDGARGPQGVPGKDSAYA